MDINKILNADYLDLLFEGRNKKYGSYELRKKYKQRMLLGAFIAFFVFIAAFAATLIKPKEEVIVEKPVIKEVTLTNPPPLDPHKPPPPPPPSTPPPPVRPTVRFTPPVIKKDNEVKEEDKPEPPKPEENKVVGPKDIAGTDDPNAIDPNLNTVSGNGTGPVVPAAPAKEEIFRFVDQQASFPGGEAALQKYLQRHVTYPLAARQASIQGRVSVQFVVDQNGGISDVTILKDIGGGCGQAVVDAVKGMPKWSPGKNNGHPVKSFFVVPFTFSLQ